jgi:hypothetical protein
MEATVRSRALWATVLCFSAVLVSCGSETAILVEVNVSGWNADLIHLEVSDESGAVIGRNFEVQPSQPTAVIDLRPGEVVSNSFSIVVYVYSQEYLVAQSQPQSAAFKKGRTIRVSIEVQGVPQGLLPRS